jgi:hypothetical protein
MMISRCYKGVFEKLGESGCLPFEINAAKFREDYFSANAARRVPGIMRTINGSVPEHAVAFRN